MEAKLEFLLENFNYIPRKGIYESKRKKIGVSNGDDSSLMIDVSDRFTIIWWKENRGAEYTIFDGRRLRTKEEFEQVFDLLGLKIENGKPIFQY